jgi:hypothetical protein
MRDEKERAILRNLRRQIDLGVRRIRAITYSLATALPRSSISSRAAARPSRIKFARSQEVVLKYKLFATLVRERTTPETD